jgi:peptidoglycan/xylan/chitin deacetylase (PgdA/CDA1 family)
MTWTRDTVDVRFNHMSVTRGDFLKQLGKSLPGMVLGGGVAAAAQKVLGKVAAASGGSEVPSSTSLAKPVMVKDNKIGFTKNGPSHGNRIALTFDDGPTPGVTDRILDELKQRNLHATFFMIGQRIAAAPDLARRVLAEGHEIGNHTYTHPNLTTLPAVQVDAEIQMTEDVIADVLQHRCRWFRPPYGALRQNQTDMLMARGLGVVLWNVDPADWSQPGEDHISSTVLSETKPGSIILCHDAHAQTANCIGPILDGLIQRSFALTTLSELLA